MTFEKYIKAMNKIYNKHPNLKHIKVVFAKDEEANSFKEVDYPPCLGIMDEDIFGEYYENEKEVNAICLN